MDIVSEIITAVMGQIDVAFMLDVNILTWLIIKQIDSRNGEKPVDQLVKFLISVFVGAAVGAVAIFACSVDAIKILYSFLLSLVSWDFIFKPLFKKVNIDYFKDGDK